MSNLKAIQDKQEEINSKQEEINNFEIDASDCENLYIDMLDECYPELFNMLPSRILEECDPIAYRCGLTDYADSLDIEEDENYILLLEELEELENELQDLEDEQEDEE